MGKSSNSALVVLAFFAIYVIWGSTYLLNKIAVLELAPFMLASCRFTLAGLFIFLLAKIMGISLRITKKQALNTIIAGILFLSVGNGLVVWALRYVDTGFAALEISSQPLIILLMMRVLQGKKIQPMSVVGVVLGIIGIYLLVSQKEIITQEESILGMMMIFFCMVCWAYASLFVAKADLPSNYFVNTGYQMFFAGLILSLMSMAFGEEWSSPLVWSTEVQISHGTAHYFWKYCRIYLFQLFVKDGFSRKSSYLHLC
jgi:drug/metabolite transporter (DMT)-like permease